MLRVENAVGQLGGPHRFLGYRTVGEEVTYWLSHGRNDVSVDVLSPRVVASVTGRATSRLKGPDFSEPRPISPSRLKDIILPTVIWAGGSFAIGVVSGAVFGGEPGSGVWITAALAAAGRGTLSCARRLVTEGLSGVAREKAIKVEGRKSVGQNVLGAMATLGSGLEVVAGKRSLVWVATRGVEPEVRQDLVALLRAQGDSAESYEGELARVLGAGQELRARDSVPLIKALLHYQTVGWVGLASGGEFKGIDPRKLNELGIHVAQDLVTEVHDGVGVLARRDERKARKLLMGLSAAIPTAAEQSAWAMAYVAPHAAIAVAKMGMGFVLGAAAHPFLQEIGDTIHRIRANVIPSGVPGKIEPTAAPTATATPTLRSTDTPTPAASLTPAVAAEATPVPTPAVTEVSIGPISIAETVTIPRGGDAFQALRDSLAKQNWQFDSLNAGGENQAWAALFNANADQPDLWKAMWAVVCQPGARNQAQAVAIFRELGFNPTTGAFAHANDAERASRWGQLIFLFENVPAGASFKIPQFADAGATR